MNFDTYCRKIFNGIIVRHNSPVTLSEVAYPCKKCGEWLYVCYHEDRIYSVTCTRCNTVTLVRARNPDEAAAIVGGENEKYKLPEMNFTGEQK